MPHRPDAPHVVLPCRSGDNRELRYALRSIEKNFDYGHIWIVGAWPRWLNTQHDHLTAVARPRQRIKYATTRSHYRWACTDTRVSDPWVMWNDDFFALCRTPELPAIHRGRCSEVTPMFRTWTSKWAIGLRETERVMKKLMPGRTLYNYDIHVPMIVSKHPMLRALDVAEAMRIPAPHVRTLYGNLARLGGTAMPDPKIERTRHRRPAEKCWLSSKEDTFRTAVEPILTDAGLHARSPFELRGVADDQPARTRGEPAAPNPHSPSKVRMRYRVVQSERGAQTLREPVRRPAGPTATPIDEHRRRRHTQQKAPVTTPHRRRVA